MSRVLPILFNTEMVRAILDGRKTVTRRVVHRGESYPECHGKDKFYGVVDHLNNDYKNWYAGFYNDNDVFIGYDGGRHTDALYWKAPCKPGDILYVRETWGIANFDYDDKTVYITYKASENEKNEGCRAVRFPNNKFEKLYDSMAENSLDWHPSLHMPKEAARIWLKVTDVRVERLQKITEHEAEKEGFCDDVEYCMGNTARGHFAELWNHTIKKSDIDRYGWDANPWVWVIEFERCEKP